MNHDERRALLADFHRSGLSQAKFAEERGITPSALGYYLKAERRAGNGSAAPEPAPAQPNLVSDLQERLFQERAKVEALQRVILVLGYQL